MKNSILRHFIPVVCLLLIAGGAHAGEAGRVVLAVGDVQIAGQHGVAGNIVREGDELATGADGYAYLKTIDNGFLILRPNTRARIVAYHIDTQDASNTRVKLELLYGVARNISGEAVKKARQNFRFNTPIAAIGVRGTDFTVYTDQQATRITVISGGVIASGFSPACTPQGGGPCEGSASLELFAHQAGQLLQISRGQTMPQLLRNNGIVPDSSAPPRSDEPTGKDAATNAGKLALDVNDVNLDVQKGEMQRVASLIQPAASPAPPAIPPRQIIWGRWQTVLGQPGGVDIAKIAAAQGQLLAINPYFAILRSSGADWQMPNQGTMGFALVHGEAYIVSGAGGVPSPAGLENALLQVDFAKSTFATGFDLVSQQNERFKFQAQGVVMRNGNLVGNSQFASPTNMYVNGAVSTENGGNAAYLFSRRIDDQRDATGLAAWTRN